MRQNTGYMPVEHYGLIGNMHTAALIAMDGSLDFMCWPNFDSPSVFCRMLAKGGSFTITPTPKNGVLITKQQYLHSSNILKTMYFGDDGAMEVVNFFPRPKHSKPLEVQSASGDDAQLKKWLVRRVERIRGEISFTVRVLPAFNYARVRHVVEFNEQTGESGVCAFRSKDLVLDFYVTEDEPDEGSSSPAIHFDTTEGHSLGRAIETKVRLRESQECSFVLKDNEQGKYLWSTKDHHSVSRQIAKGYQGILVSLDLAVLL